MKSTSADRPSIEWRSLDIDGASGRIANTFLTHGGSRIVVVLPGFIGGWNTPATYYPVLALLDGGFDALCLDSIYSEHPTIHVLTADAHAALEAARRAGDYSELAVAGKSLGTLAISELLLDGTIAPTTPSIWLTPLLRSERTKRALDSLEHRALIVIGTADPHYDPEALRTLRHTVAVIEGANHGLAVDGDAVASAEIPRRLVAAVRDYVA